MKKLPDLQEFGIIKPDMTVLNVPLSDLISNSGEYNFSSPAHTWTRTIVQTWSIRVCLILSILTDLDS